EPLHGLAEPSAGQHAGEDVDDQRQREALVPGAPEPTPPAPPPEPIPPGPEPDPVPPTPEPRPPGPPG
ncbi:hypothetical protein, partial [Actinomadura geliboluensis]